jgi:pantetheine-phosphate adenylyltransferase
MYRRSLVAMSADPFHHGHLDLICRAKQQCEKLFVLVANNDQKLNSYTFTLKERVDIVTKAVAKLPGVEVITPPSMVLADTYLQFNCDVLFRGIRNPTDYEYERRQMEYHRLVYSKVNDQYLQADEKLGLVSSSIIKTFVSHHIDVSEYVTAPVKKMLEERIAKQFKIAVTGQMAVGKSWVTDMLVKRMNDSGLHEWAPINFPNQARAIKLDDIIRQIYEDPIPGAEAMRQEIDDFCRDQTNISVLKDGIIDRKILGGVLFSPKMGSLGREKIQQITKPLIHMRYRQLLTGFTGVVVFEWAQLAEMSMGHWTNYNVIVVDSPDRDQFLKSRGITPEVAKARTATQWSSEDKARKLNYEAELAGCGTVIEFSNPFKESRGGRHDDNFNALLKKVSKILGFSR